MHAVLIRDGAVEQYPYGPGELRRDHPTTSFPAVLTAAELAEWGVHEVEGRDPPQHDHATQNCERVQPTLQSGRWVETWSVTPASPEQIAERTAERAAQVRSQRNALLSGTDWTQAKDVTDAVSQPWAVYRQALRDVPQQPGFPWAIEWPAAPA